MSNLLEVRGLTVELPTPAGWVRPVSEVSLRIAAGESFGLVGESGSGKTMLSLALMGLLPPGARVSGEASLARKGSAKKLTALTEREWREVRGGEIAMVFQEPMTSLNPVMRIGAQIEEAIRAHQPQLANAEVKRKLLDALRLAACPAPDSPARRAATPSRLPRDVCRTADRVRVRAALRTPRRRMRICNPRASNHCPRSRCTLHPGVMDTLLTVRELRKTYRRGGGVFSQDSDGARFTAVDDVSFSVTRGDTFAVVGESGCGKTTPARMLLRLIEPDGGAIAFPV